MYSSGSDVTIGARFGDPDSKARPPVFKEPIQSRTLGSSGRMHALNATLKEPKTLFNVLERRQRDSPHNSNYIQENQSWLLARVQSTHSVTAEGLGTGERK
jgi:hypothetical protein